MAYYEGEVSGLGNNNNGFGGDGWWVIILFALIFGWGRGGYGGFGGGTGTEGAMNNYVLSSDFSMLSRQVSDGFNSQERKLDSITNGLCDGFYTQAQLVNGVNMNIANTGYQIQSGIAGLGTQLQGCCCDIREGIAGINYNMAQNTCAITNAINNSARDIIDNANCNYRSLHDELVAYRIEDKNSKIAEQQAMINALQLKASQEQQNAYLLNALKPCPNPAYIVPNPNCCYGAYGQNTGCNTCGL